MSDTHRTGVSFRDGMSSAYHMTTKTGARLDVSVWPSESRMNEPQRRDVAYALAELTDHMAEKPPTKANAEEFVAGTVDELSSLEDGLEQLETAMADFERGVDDWTLSDRFTQKKQLTLFRAAAAATKEQARVLRSLLASALAKR